MTKHLISLAAALALTAPVSAQEEPQGEPSPNEIVAGADADEWVKIPAEDIVVMTLAPDEEGNPRQVIIQLMPAPFSRGWVENIRTLASAEWYDDIAVNRVQDNYVVQWGDPNYDNPEAEGEAKPLPEGLKIVPEEEYTTENLTGLGWSSIALLRQRSNGDRPPRMDGLDDVYAERIGFSDGWPIAGDTDAYWPVHCYGMIGVGRGMSPDTGSGAELYTVIGHAPRHLDRNIALVGRIVEGIEHLSSLPRGTGALGFYTAEEAGKRTPILSVRVASNLPENEQPSFEYLSTEGETFARYADARANRRDPFFIVPAGGADICNIPVPLRRVAE
ncbi:MAG: peptidylprolyl isomerase [Qipengyuania vulgaris]